MNKKIWLSFLLGVLIVLSVSSVSAEDVSDVVAADDEADVISESVDNNILSTVIKPTSNDYQGIQNAIDQASDGDTIDLSDIPEYDTSNNTIKIVDKDNLLIKGNGTTTIKTYGGYKDTGSTFEVQGKSITFQGIRFIDTDPDNNITYGGEIHGWCINFKGTASEGGIVENCYFQDFNQAVRSSDANNITVRNNYFKGGIATKILNDPSVKKETGSKVVSIMGALSCTVINNTFDGPVLDALSIAGGSSQSIIINNTFINSVYAIYFGGASTDGTYIINNTFITCGCFVLPERDIFWTFLPVISVQKSSSNININNNTFRAVNGNYLIGAEQGNSAHGFPSPFGNNSFCDNTVELNDSSVDARSITFLHIKCIDNVLNPFADVKVTGNNLPEGIKEVIVWSTEWGTEDGTHIILPAADLIKTQMVITSMEGTKIVGVLQDINGAVVDSAAITYSIDGGSPVSIVTDENGAFSIVAQSGKPVVISFAGNNKYLPAEDLTLTPVEITKTVTKTVSKKSVALKAPKKTFKVKKVKKVKITLKSSGKAVAGKKVTINVNGKKFSAKTNKKGVATIKVKLNKKGTYSYVASFAGDSTYNAGLKAGKIVVKK